jgi:hypothetical protein
MTSLNRFISVLCASLCLFIAQLDVTAKAQAPEVYAAHPDRTLEMQVSAYSNLMVSESLYALALYHDGLTEKSKSELYFELLSSPAVAFLLGTPRVTRPEQTARFELMLQGALRSWGRSEPTLSSDPGAFSNTQLSARKKLELAHSLYRLTARVRGLEFPLEPYAVIESGWSLHSQRPILIDTDCESKISALAPLSQLCRWVKTWRTQWIHDVWQIVTPHFSPLRASLRESGQLEALSVHLTRVSFAGDSTLRRTLKRLQNISHLDDTLSEWEAIQKAVQWVSRVPLLPIEQLRLIN